mmetsp:Transcript_24656/g.60629  ORF Transcript_24656/g.60629 Transcript_24656/m.60629 type:complete len:206 (-) Transcript_24656:572-1189(-)
MAMENRALAVARVGLDTLAPCSRMTAATDTWNLISGGRTGLMTRAMVQRFQYTRFFDVSEDIGMPGRALSASPSATKEYLNVSVPSTGIAEGKFSRLSLARDSHTSLWKGLPRPSQLPAIARKNFRYAAVMPLAWLASVTNTSSTPSSTNSRVRSAGGRNDLMSDGRYMSSFAQVMPRVFKPPPVRAMGIMIRELSHPHGCGKDR